LITGFNGFVAGSILAQAPADWELHGIGRSAAPDTVTEVSDGSGRLYHQLDLLDAAGLDRLVRTIRPDAVIHAAAIANIDLCEREQEMAEDLPAEAHDIRLDLVVTPSKVICFF